MSEYSEDIKRAIETKENIELLRKKYPRYYAHDISRLVDVLEIADQYAIPIDNMWLNSYNTILLSGKTGSFEFIIIHSYQFSNRATDYKIDENNWYVNLSFRGRGRLNLVNNANGDNQYLYFGEFQKAWEEFIETIKGYHPVQYDDINHEYFFTVPDGYKLFCDFPDILKKAENKFNKLNKKREIEELNEKLRKLEEDNEGNGEWK